METNIPEGEGEAVDVPAIRKTVFRVLRWNFSDKVKAGLRGCRLVGCRYIANWGIDNNSESLERDTHYMLVVQ
jgi:hypothetical protein